MNTGASPMSSTHTSAIHTQEDQAKTRFLIGLHEERPCPGAVAFQAIAAKTNASTYRNPGNTQDHDHAQTRRTVALVLTEAPRQEDAHTAHFQLLDLLSPLLGMGQVGLPMAIDLMGRDVNPHGHQVLLWSDGHHAQLLFRGDHRIIYIHGDQASLIRPTSPGSIGHCSLPLHHRDILVMVAHATQAQLPLGTVSGLALQADSMQSLCVQATQQAAANDPLSHHATLALTIHHADKQ